MKHVVILGGGFAGIAATQELLKRTSSKDIHITLIDKNAYHVFTPSLYEVATSEEPTGNIAIPFKEIFGKRVQTVLGKVEKIDTKSQQVSISTQEKSYTDTLTQTKKISYDYLILALGSEPSFFHIPGLKEYSIALKSLREATMIKNKILTLCCKDGVCKKKVQVVIGGGGFSGTELAAELLTYKNRIARQHHLDKNCLEITIIQGSERLLKELDPHVSRIAEGRLKGPHMRFAFGGHIIKVTKHSVFTDSNSVYAYDILIWTGGVKANSILSHNNFPINKRGQVIVNNYLQVEGFENIFAAGDNTQFIIKSSQTTAPTVAQVAEDEGRVVGKNITQLLKNKTLYPYAYKHFGYIIPLRGKYAAAELMGMFHFDGIIGWVLQQVVFLRYLLGILPVTKALRKWNAFEQDLEQ